MVKKKKKVSDQTVQAVKQQHLPAKQFSMLCQREVLIVVSQC